MTRLRGRCADDQDASLTLRPVPRPACCADGDILAALLIRRLGDMLEDQRPGTAYWVDHYVVPTADVPRWAKFYEDVLGATTRVDEREARPGRRGGLQFTDVGICHVGGSRSDQPLAPT